MSTLLMLSIYVRWEMISIGSLTFGYDDVDMVVVVDDDDDILDSQPQI